MNKFSFWGWTLILLGVYLLSVIFISATQFSSWGSGLDIGQIILYYIMPAFWGLIISVAVAGFAALVGKNIFSTQAEGFFLVLNCMLLGDIAMRLTWPILNKAIQILQSFGNLFGGGFQ